MKTILLSILLLASTIVSGQENYTSKTQLDKSTNKIIENAEKAFKKKDYKKARKEYEKALKKYPNLIHAVIRMGTIELEEKKPDTAIQYFSSAADLSASYEPKVLSTLAALYENKDDYRNALKYYRLYKKEITSEKKLVQVNEKIQLNQLRDSLVRNKVAFERIRLEETINTAAAEYLPALSADGSTLIFARIVNGQEDFFMSSLNDSTYEESLPIHDLNTQQNEAAHTLSADGKVIVFTACDRRNGFGSCDLYYSTKKHNGWSKAKNLGGNINSDAWDSQPSVSSDGKVIYFSSRREGGLGGADIYFSTLVDRVWSVPTPLPDNINTTGNEMSPFIHADGRTLYFKSDKHPGMGSYDIFVSRKEGEKWSDPVNLGYPINTKADDGALSISTDGLTAYYSSDAGEEETVFGIKKRTNLNYDIYKFELPEEVRPTPTTYIKFLVMDALSKSPIQSKLVISAAEREIYNKTSGAAGDFLTILTSGENYSVHVEKEGYLFYSEHVTMEKETSFFEPMIRTILLYPIPKKEEKVDPIIYDTPIALRNIFFETDSSNLLPESLPEIKKLQSLLLENPTIRIRIIGHTDNIGTPEYNKNLSQSRSNAVKNKLVELGVEHSRLSIVGMGESEPIASNDDESGRQLNRRTEFVIIK